MDGMGRKQSGIRRLSKEISAALKAARRAEHLSPSMGEAGVELEPLCQ